jgi:hypothetical protein
MPQRQWMPSKQSPPAFRRPKEGRAGLGKLGGRPCAEIGQKRERLKLSRPVVSFIQCPGETKEIPLRRQGQQRDEVYQVGAAWYPGMA